MIAEATASVKERGDGASACVHLREGRSINLKRVSSHMSNLRFSKGRRLIEGNIAAGGCAG
jgi:hypothetical protein